MSSTCCDPGIQQDGLPEGQIEERLTSCRLCDFYRSEPNTSASAKICNKIRHHFGQRFPHKSLSRPWFGAELTRVSTNETRTFYRCCERPITSGWNPTEVFRRGHEIGTSYQSRTRRNRGGLQETFSSLHKNRLKCESCCY